MKKAIDVAWMFPEFELIRDRALKDRIVAVWQELWAASEFTDIGDVPTSGSIPYPNLPHSRAVLSLCVRIADVFEQVHGTKVDRDTLIAAAILQDASKVVEYRPRPGGGVDRTEIGQTYPHAYWAGMLATKHGIAPAIVHIILFHSPSAAKFPASLEGKIIYYADQLDVIAISGDHWKKESFIYR
ncbi:MAG: HD domain-containing protein [Alphaproteobacteria bacterium]|nr:HD domain-containing protein [Alphaproteobacteria bacterium]